MQHFSQNIPGFFSDEDFQFYDQIVQQLSQRFSRLKHVVEIGSFKGRSSSRMAVNLINLNQYTQFDCVDTWLGSPEHFEGVFQDSDVVQGRLFDVFQNNMLPVRGSYRTIRLPSDSAAQLYDNGTLDFVFIDGDHSYDAVVNDIKSWVLKVRSGGVIAGHDWPYSLEVQQAVIEQLGQPQLSGACWYFWR